MIIKELSKHGLGNSLKCFIEDMFKNWKQDSSFSQDNSCCSQRPIEELLKKIDATDGINSEFLILLNEEDTKFIGMVLLEFNKEGKSAYLSLVNIHPDYRRKKGGFLLVTSSMILAYKNDIEYITLETWNSNDRAIKIFNKFGFFEIQKTDKCIELKSYFPKIIQEMYEINKMLGFN